MIETEALVYLQLQKTGCTHIEKLLNRQFGDVFQKGKHYCLPVSFEITKPIVGSIRNPWNWYLSYWSYSCSGRGGIFERTCGPRSALMRTIRDDRVVHNCRGLDKSLGSMGRIFTSELLRPRATWQSVTQDSSNPEQFRHWLKLLLEDERRYDAFQDYGLSSFSGQAGLLTYLYFFLYTLPTRNLYESRIWSLEDLVIYDREHNVTNYMIRNESLESDYLDMLSEIGLEVSNSLSEEIRKTHRTNTSQRSYPVAEYYDKETRELVGERDAFVVEKYGYSFPGDD